MDENSPAFQSWVWTLYGTSPVGTAEDTQVRPSLRDLGLFGTGPSVETLGYSRLSLRDKRPEFVRERAGRRAKLLRHQRPTGSLASTHTLSSLLLVA